MNPRLRLACAASLVALPVAASAALAQPAITTMAPGTLTVCTYGGFPPTSYATGGGTWAGLDATFVGRFARSVGLSVTPRISTSFAGIWQRPGTGECDMAAAGITVTDERRQQAAASTFSAPYHATLRAYVVRRGSVLTGPRGLAGKTILVVKGSIAQQDVQRRVRRAGVPGVRIRFTTGGVAARQAVRSGRAFAYETDDLSAGQAARLDPRLAVAWLHPRADAQGRSVREDLAYVVRDASTGLLPALNAFIAENRDDYAT